VLLLWNHNGIVSIVFPRYRICCHRNVLFNDIVENVYVSQSRINYHSEQMSAYFIVIYNKIVKKFKSEPSPMLSSPFFDY
jgi:hypothetical protein